MCFKPYLWYEKFKNYYGTIKVSNDCSKIWKTNNIINEGRKENVMEWIRDINKEEFNEISTCSTCPNNHCTKVFCPIEIGGVECTKRGCFIYVA